MMVSREEMLLVILLIMMVLILLENVKKIDGNGMNILGLMI